MGVPMRLSPGVYFFQPIIRSQRYGECRIVPVLEYVPGVLHPKHLGVQMLLVDCAWVRIRCSGHLYCRVPGMQGVGAVWFHGPDALALKDGRAPKCTPYLEPRP